MIRNTTKPKVEFSKNQASGSAWNSKAKELYGQTAEAYGTYANKRDGGLMASGADWRNTGQQAANMSSPMKGKNMESGADARDKKYSQLQSSVFGGGYLDGQKADYDRENKRVAFGSAADWKTEAGMQKPNNGGGSKVDTF